MALRRILFLTQAPEARGALVDALRQAGHAVTVSPQPVGRVAPDLVIVDLASGNLWELARLWSAGRLILMVATPEDLRRGFEIGADDCVLADTPVEEVVARCEASLRRTSQADSVSGGEAPALYADGRVWVNFDLRQVWAAGRSAHLTGREHRLLRFLIDHADEPMSYESILEHVWGRSGGRQAHEVLKQYIWRLRQKLEPNPNRPQVIVTVPGKGYQFVRHSE